MKHFFLIANRQNERAGALMQEAAELIRATQGCTAVMDPESLSNRHTAPSDVPKDTEAVLVFGGDGTIIRAVRDLKPLSLPLLGVNAGTLGYLAETDPEDLENTIRLLTEDTFFVEERMMISGRIVREEPDGQKETTIYEDVGLNDIVLSGRDNTRLLSYSVYVDGEFLKSYKADGLILATPTGSTAYNLSAGGPIAMPSADMMLLTPLNAHTLMSRTIVLPGSSLVRVKLSEKSGVNAVVHYDGGVFSGILPGDVIEIRRAEEHAHLIRLRRDSFTEILSKKLEN